VRCEIKLEHQLVGFVAESHRGPGEVTVVTSEFTSSEDGLHFVSRLEGIQESIISHVPDCPPPSMIDSFLAVIRRDLTTSIVLNEVAITGKIAPKRNVKKGELIVLDDIADILRVDFDAPVPNECGVVFIESFGWRKSLFFDLSPLSNPPKLRTYDLGSIIGQQHAYLLFQDQVRITDQQWNELFEQSWFPFRMLPLSRIRIILNQAKESWSIDEEILKEPFVSQMNVIADPESPLLSRKAFFEHRDLLRHAFERFRAGDYKSTTALLFPRIEGVLRSIYGEQPSGRITSSKLAAASTAKYEEARGTSTLLMPDKFREYLDRVYFRGWGSGTIANHLSRHTVAHGVARQEQFDLKAAAVGVLIVLQLALYLT
jgi:hypothetical protein